MLYLIYADLFWSVAAFVWDWPKMAQIHFYVWPFALICPIYPLLLAIIWFQLYRKKSPNQFLLAFATIPSIVFGILAIVYYPTAMYYQGFSWNGLGQIFWVIFYAAQGAYLFSKYQLAKWPLALASAYLIVKLCLDYKYLTFGYLDFTNIPQLAVLILIVIGLISLGFLTALVARKTK